jgi:hypothetical protein
LDSRSLKRTQELRRSGPGEHIMDMDFGGPSRLDSVTYILAMTKPLVEIAKKRKLGSLVYYLEMAVLDAADLENRLKNGKLPDPDDDE